MHAKSSIRSEAEIMCDALRWAAFGGVHRGQSFTYKEIRKDVWRFETEYFGKRAWVNLELPVTALSLLLAGAVVLQQLNSMSEGLV